VFLSRHVRDLEGPVPNRCVMYRNIKRVVGGREDEAKREQEVQDGEMKLEKKH
jgi:hypothetical protein